MIKQLIRFFKLTLFYKHYSKGVTKNNMNDKISFNVYKAENQTMQEFAKEQNFIHGILKNMFIAPGIRLLHKFCNKHLVKEVPDKDHFNNLRLFNEVYKDSMVDWSDLYLMHTNNKPKVTLFNKLRNHSNKLLLKMLHFLNTIIVNDTSYLSFFDILTYNYVLRLNKECPQEIKHLLYTSRSINDIRYFKIKDNSSLNIKIPGLQINNQQITINITPEQLNQAIVEEIVRSKLNKEARQNLDD